MCYFAGLLWIITKATDILVSLPSHTIITDYYRQESFLFLRLSPSSQWSICLQRNGHRGAQFYHTYVLWFYSKLTLLVCQSKILVCLLPDTWSKIFSALHLFSRTISFSGYLRASGRPLVKFSWKLSVLQKWPYILFDNEDTYSHV